MTTPHDYFGSMKLDEQRRQYQATLDFSPSHKVSVTIDWAGISPSEALTRSRDVCDRIRVREPEYRRKIAQTLLSLYNDTWGDGAALDADGFMRQISLSDIQICPADFGTDGSATLYYADGDLFAGHWIEVFLDANFNYVRSQIAG
jgi:hypothetical protein